MKCIKCDSRFTKEEIKWDKYIFGNGYRTEKQHPNQPKCINCSGRIISSVVNFGDPMPEIEIRHSYDHSEQSDVFFVIGSTLTVMPAADFPRIAKSKGAFLIIINNGDTALDSLADIRIEGDCSVILPRIVDVVKQIKNPIN